VRIVNRILQVIVGLLFLVAGVFKIWNVNLNHGRDGANVTVSIRASATPDVATFAQQVENYRVPPYALTNTVAIILPWVELVAGVLLVCGVWTRPSALVFSVLTIIFLLAIGQAVVRGLNINCGCFGTVEGRKVGVVALGEDVVLLAVCLWLYSGKTTFKQRPTVVAPTPIAK